MSSEAGESSIHPRSPLQLEFVSVTQDNFQHGKFRQHLAVRRHVMRHVMLERSRRERLAATKKFQQKQGPCQKSAPPENSGSSAAPATQASGEVPTQEGKAAFKDEESCVSVKLNLVKQHPAAWKMDPFGSFAASLDSNTQAGLEYCKCSHNALKSWIPERGVVITLFCLHKPKSRIPQTTRLSPDVTRRLACVCLGGIAASN